MSEQLAQAKRNFEVGVATITDTNEAQARYDSIVAQEIIARNDLDNRRTALRTIIGRMPRELKKLGPGFEPTLPEPNVLDPWIERALTDNLNVKIAGYNFDVASLEIDRARAGAPAHGRPRGRREPQPGDAARSAATRTRRRARRRSGWRSTSRSTRAASSIRACASRSRCRTPRARISRARGAMPWRTRRSASPA